jgi:hypothetical protein
MLVGPSFLLRDCHHHNHQRITICSFANKLSIFAIVNKRKLTKINIETTIVHPKVPQGTSQLNSNKGKG